MRLRLLIIIIGILLLFGLVGYLAYQTGYSLGRQEGYLPSPLPTGTPNQSENLETQKIKIFFSNPRNPNWDCNLVEPTERVIPKTPGIARAALEELFKGPTIEEKSLGFVTNIPEGVKIQQLTIDNQIAKADFNKTLDQNVGGSCRVTAIRAQITETLKQFSTVKNVIISIEGRTEDILQP